MPVDNTSPSYVNENRLHETSGEKSRAYGDNILYKSTGTVRILSHNIGNLPVDILASTKNQDFLNRIKNLKADCCLFCEHGLNPMALSRHQQWSERIHGQFENIRS